VSFGDGGEGVQVTDMTAPKLFPILGVLLF
jgi:hypothetical protein